MLSAWKLYTPRRYRLRRLSWVSPYLGVDVDRKLMKFAEMRQVRTKATPWHTRSGYFLELPLAYYLAHSSLFFGPATKDAGVHGDGDADPYGPDRCRAIKQLTVWLKQATYTPAKGESFDQAILALKARHSGDKLAWLCKDGSTACLLSQLPRARPRPAAAVERPNSTD